MANSPKNAVLGALNAELAIDLADGSVTVALIDDASFVGTVKLQRRPKTNNGVAWVGRAGYSDMASYTAVTTDADETTSNYMGGAWEVCLVVSAYTSGSLRGCIGATAPR